MADMKGCISQLLEDYRRAFDDAEAEKIADCYHTPCVTVRGDGTFHLLQDRQDVVDFLGKVARQYRDEGMAGGVYSIIDIQAIGTKCALVTVDWALLNAEGQPIREWRQSYNVIKSGEKCRFYVSTFHV